MKTRAEEDVQTKSSEPHADEKQLVRTTLVTTLLDDSGVDGALDVGVKEKEPMVGSISVRPAGQASSEATQEPLLAEVAVEQ